MTTMNNLPPESSTELDKTELDRTVSVMSKTETALSQIQRFLAGGGEMGARMRSIDWSKTSLGSVENWSQSLLSAVSICLGSAFPIGIYWGAELELLYNDAWSPILGTKHPWALGQPAQVVWPEIWDAIEPLFHKVKQTGEGVWQKDQLLLMNRHGYTEECYFNFTFSPIQGETGVEGIFNAVVETTYQVISERRTRVLRQLAERTSGAKSAEEVFKLAAETISSAAQDIPFALLYLLDSDGKKAHLVDSVGIEAGLPVSPVVILLEETNNEIWSLSKVAQSGKVAEVSQLTAHFSTLPSGVWGEPSDTALVLPIAGVGQERPYGLLVAGVSPRRKLDTEYRNFFELFANQIATVLGNARAYEQERQRAEALAELDRAKTTFFSNVSHEFRTPLTLMLGPIEDLLNETNGVTAPYQSEQLKTLHRNSLRLLKLVNSLLDFSRIEAGRVQAIYQPTNLATYTADLASTFRSTIEKAGMQLTVDCPPLAEPVYVDRDMWEKIVLNLLSNAFKYTLAGEITLKLQSGKDMVELSVQDTGTGIPDNEIVHIFERFHRVQGSQGRTYEGTGIGLSLVQELVKLHSGSIRVESVVGVGSIFRVTIPLGTKHLPKERISDKPIISSTALGANSYVEEALRWLPGHAEMSEIIQDVPADYLGAIMAEKPLAPGPGKPKAKIVLADDNADMREYVSKLLATRYEVMAVANGRLALNLVLKEPPDLVLTDVMMPELDGFGLLKELRANPLTNTIPILMLSARAGEEARIEGMEAGVDDYLVKPFSARELLARVSANLEMARIRREAHEEIRQAQQHLASVINNSPIIFWSVDKQGIYTLSEGKGLEVLGVKPGELVGKSHYEIYKDLPELVEPVDRALKGETLTNILEFQGLYYETTYSPLRDEKGAISGIVAVSTDITAQVLARQKTEESEERFRTLADNISQLVWMTDENGWIYWYNQRWYDYTGTSLEEMAGWGWQKVHHPDHVKRVVDKISQHFQTGEDWEDTFPLRGKDGAYRWFLSRAIPIRDENGAVLRWFGTNTDITERLELEQRRDEFIGIASHELKTPVTSLKAYGQVLQTMFKRQGDLKAVEQLGKMDVQINKLTGLITDLLDITKLQGGKLQFKAEDFDFNDLVTEIVEELQHTTERHTLLKEFGPTKIVYGDRDRIGQVVTNLLSNAIKYSSQADKILVQTTTDNRQMTLSVQDFGIGIAPDKQAHIFERFYRVTGENQETFPGLGLGLYISSEIISRQNGRIWVESTVGKGSTFSFSLPVQNVNPLQPANNSTDTVENVNHAKTNNGSR